MNKLFMGLGVLVLAGVAGYYIYSQRTTETAPAPAPIAAVEEAEQPADLGELMPVLEDAAKVVSTSKKDIPLALTIGPDEMQWGNPNAPVQIVEYASLTCSHCGAFHTETWPELKKQLVDTGKVHFAFRFLPWDNLALAASKIVACGKGEQRDVLLSAFMKTQAQWVTAEQPLDALKQTALVAGMTADEAEACIKDESIHADLLKARDIATKDLGVSATPTFFVNSTKLVGAQPLSAFEKVVAEQAN